MSRRMASTEFRVTYHNLTEPVDVTVLGRVIGRYVPTEFGRYWEPVEDEWQSAAPRPFVVLPPLDEEIDYGRVKVADVG